MSFVQFYVKYFIKLQIFMILFYSLRTIHSNVPAAIAFPLRCAATELATVKILAMKSDVRQNILADATVRNRSISAIIICASPCPTGAMETTIVATIPMRIPLCVVS